MNGFEVLEVWESKEHMTAPTPHRLPADAEAGGRPTCAAEHANEAFEVHGLVIPPADILI